MLFLSVTLKSFDRLDVSEIYAIIVTCPSVRSRMLSIVLYDLQFVKLSCILLGLA